MKRILFSFVLVLAVVSQGFSQSGVWRQLSAKDLAALVRESDNGVDEGQSYYAVNTTALKNQLITATDKFSGQPGIVVSFPNLNGEMEAFEVWENSNMEPAFQAQFPEIRSYVGKGLTDKSAQINFSLSPLGLQTMVIRADASGAEFLERYDKNATAYVLFTSAARVRKGNFSCTTIDAGMPADLIESINNGVANKASNAIYKTMRLALSCTAEYANYFGATSSSQQSLVVAAMNATMTRVNGVFEKDLAIHLNMIDNTSIIYYVSSSDPYSPASGMSNWNTQLMNTLHNTLGDSAFDIGHLFGRSGGGGNAGCIGCVCSNVLATGVSSNSANANYKGSGITSPGANPDTGAQYPPSGDVYDIDYVAHEMGHQFGANHSFTENYEGTVAQVEIGSGSTIMGYAGIDNYNVQKHSDPIFCYKNISQIQSNLNGSTKTCPVNTALSGINAKPVVNAGLDYTIPVGTAFVLTGTATDSDGDTLSYIWEQNDVEDGSNTGANCMPSDSKSVGPIFRIFNTTSTTERYFPQMGKILSNTLTVSTPSTIPSGMVNIISQPESLLSIDRVLNFVFTARDSHVGGPQTSTDAAKVTVSTAAGPFTCTSQAAAGLSYNELTQVPVTWNVAGTTASPFNAANVDILLSTNVSTTLQNASPYNLSGTPNTTSWTTIASNVPNNGSYTVTLPDVAATSTTCRFMVKAVGNVFLAVNSKNFTINNVVASASVFGGLKNFNLYPNPNNGQFTLSFDSVTTNDIEVLVHDMRGREIYKNTFANTGAVEQNIGLAGAQTGMYLVTVKDGNNKEVKKIVVE